MKLAIVGSRSIYDYAPVKALLDEVLMDNQHITTVVSGGAMGIDRFAAIWAKDNNLQLIEHIPDWQTNGRAAGFIRNEQIIKDADYVVAIWDGVSKGTVNSMQWAKRFNKPLMVCNFFEAHYEDENGNTRSSWEIGDITWSKNGC
jgi:hypothetical protein